MSEKWIFSSTFLPYTGEPIDFLLEDRETPISGTFADGKFRSRWADFSADQVQSWREAAVDPAHAPIAAPPTLRHLSWTMTLKRLARRLLSPRATAVRKLAVVAEPEMTILAAQRVGAHANINKRYPDSNQTAS